MSFPFGYIYYTGMYLSTSLAVASVHFRAAIASNQLLKTFWCKNLPLLRSIKILGKLCIFFLTSKNPKAQKSGCSSTRAQLSECSFRVLLHKECQRLKYPFPRTDSPQVEHWFQSLLHHPPASCLYQWISLTLRTVGGHCMKMHRPSCRGVTKAWHPK